VIINIRSPWRLFEAMSRLGEGRRMEPDEIVGRGPFGNDEGWWVQVHLPKMGFFFCGDRRRSREQVEKDLQTLDRCGRI